MSEDRIGGFFAEISAKVNSSSFTQAFKEINKTGDAMKSLAKIAIGTTSALVGTATAAGALANAQLKTSQAIGVSTSSLDKWSTAAGIAGMSTSSLTNSMKQLEDKMQRLKLGQVDTGLAKSLGMLGIGYGEAANMNANERMSAIFRAANAMEDQRKAALLIEDTLGSSAREYYEYLQMSGTTLDEQLNQARGLVFTTEESKKGAAAFHAEIKGVWAASKSIAALFGQSIAKELTPTVKRIREFIQANNDLIKSGIQGFVKETANLINGIAGLAANVIPMLQKIITSMGGLDQLIMRIGVGTLAVKIAGIGTSIAGVVKNLGLLKTGIAGLGLTALYLIVDDIMGYFSGKTSVLGGLIRDFGEIKEALGLGDLFTSWERLKDAVVGLVNAIKGNETIHGIFKGIADDLKEIAFEGVEYSIKLLTDISNILADLFSGDFVKLGQDIKSFFHNFAEGLLEVTNAKNMAEAFKDMYGVGWQTSQNKGNGKVMNSIYGVDYGTLAALEAAPIVGPLFKAVINWGAKQGNTFFEDYVKNRTNDGIIRPNGSVTQVAQDDWVFAVKNIEDLAGAFVPSKTTITNSNASENPTIVQNINITASKDVASDVKTQAYRGASEALQQSLRNTTRIMQLIPGTM